MSERLGRVWAPPCRDRGGSDDLRVLQFGLPGPQPGPIGPTRCRRQARAVSRMRRGRRSDRQQLTQVNGLVNTPRRTRSVASGSSAAASSAPVLVHLVPRQPIGRGGANRGTVPDQVDDVNIEGHSGFIAVGTDPTLGTTCARSASSSTTTSSSGRSFRRAGFPRRATSPEQPAAQSIREHQVGAPVRSACCWLGWSGRLRAQRGHRLFEAVDGTAAREGAGPQQQLPSRPYPNLLQGMRRPDRRRDRQDRRAPIRRTSRAPSSARCAAGRP